GIWIYNDKSSGRALQQEGYGQRFLLNKTKGEQMSHETVVWGIHAGSQADADKLFLHENVIALGWDDVGDLSNIPASREAFKEKLSTTYPDAKSGAIPVWAGALYRFVHEITPGDLVVYPSKVDRQIHLGRVTGAYEYNLSSNKDYPNQRSVKWLQSIARTSFTQGALYEVGTAMALFQVRNYADEFLAALEGQPIPPPIKKDETIGLVVEDIEQTTKDFVLKKFAQELKGHPFAEFVAHLLQAMGYRTRVSPEGPDGGIDVIAHKDELGFEPPIIKVQVKSSEGSIGDPTVASLYGKVDQNEFGLFITVGTFTHQAKTFARNKTNLRLIDGDEMVSLVLRHYHHFDSRYKGLIPLKRVYVPEVVEQEE
ncbi:MAG: restriction endonuclease, partial [Candidatus Zixiibacteriota bacterium]